MVGASIRGVIFDMDGVLCDSEAFMAEAAVEFFRRYYDTEVRPEDFAPFCGSGEDRYLGEAGISLGVDVSWKRDETFSYGVFTTYSSSEPGFLMLICPGSPPVTSTSTGTAL